MEARTGRPQGDVEPQQAAPNPIDQNLSIGHVHLRTADIDRVRDFYVGILGFDVILEARDVPGWGTTGDMLFVSAGGCHHHLAFNTWKSKDGGPQPDGVHGPAPRRPPLLDARAPGRRAAPAPARRLADPRAGRPRHARGDLPPRPGRERPRALLGPAPEEWPRTERSPFEDREFDVDGLLAEPEL